MKTIMVIIATSVVMYSCNTLKLTSDYDKTIDFSTYKTIEYFDWDQDGDSQLNRFDKEKIETAFNQEFNKLGLEVAEKGKGDLIVNLHIVTKQKTQTTASTYSMYGYGGYYRYGPRYGWGPGYSTTTIHENEYTEGSLIISVYDASKKLLIWETVGTTTVNWGDRKNEKAIKYIVSRMMMQFPKNT